MKNNIFLNNAMDMQDVAYVVERLPAGKSIRGAIPAPRGDDGSINPHVSRFLLDKGEYVDVFHVKPIYYATHEGTWRPLSEVASHYGNKRIVLRDGWADMMDFGYLAWLLKRVELLKGSVVMPSPVSPALVPLSLTQKTGHAHILFSTLTAYPDPNPETTTVDGRVQYFNSSGVWSTGQSATDGTSAADSNAADYLQVYHRTGSNLGIDRGFFLFNTAALTSVATISAATFSIYPDQKGDENNDSHGFWNVVQSNPASNTALSTADYDQCGDAVTSPTKGATDVDTTGITINAYVDFALNATGQGWISKTGVTKLGVRNGQDMDNANPGNSSDGQYLHVLFADTAGTTTDPKLVVTYSTAVDVTVTPSVLAKTLAVQSPSESGGAIIGTTVLSAVFSTQTASESGTAVVSPSVLSALFAVQAENVITPDALVTVSTIPASFALPGETAFTDTSVSVNTLSALFSSQGASIELLQLIAPNVLAATFSVGGASVVLLLQFNASTVGVTSAIQDPSVYIEQNALVEATVLGLTFSIPTGIFAGGLWTRVGRADTGEDWTRVPRT